MQFNYFDIQYNGEKLSKENKDLNFIPKGGARGGDGDSSKLGAMYRYPIDLGDYDKAHFAFFTIYQQENTKVGAGAGNTLDGQNNTAKFRVGQSNIGTGIETTAKILEKTYNWAGTVLSNGLTASINEGLNRFEKTEGVEGVKVLGNAIAKEFPRGNINGVNYLNQVTRIRDSIALYMPDTLAFSYNQNYSDFSFGDLGLGMVGVSAISDIAANKPKGFKDLAGQLGKNLSPFIYAGLKKTLGSTGAALFQVAANKVVNPMLELLYTSPNFREFNFDFMLPQRDNSSG